MAKNILVIGEHADSEITATTAEVIGQSTRLAEGGLVSVALLGSSAADATPQAFEAGAGKVFVNDDDGYTEYNSDQWVAAIESTLESIDVILVAQSTVGRDLAPRLAARQGTAAAMDCVCLLYTSDAADE